MKDENRLVKTVEIKPKKDISPTDPTVERSGYTFILAPIRTVSSAILITNVTIK